MSKDVASDGVNLLLVLSANSSVSDPEIMFRLQVSLSSRSPAFRFETTCYHCSVAVAFDRERRPRALRGGGDSHGHT